MADCLCGLYFTDVLWPDFKEQNLYEGYHCYQKNVDLENKWTN
jgi:undecaprenyl pyrophosphate synthase